MNSILAHNNISLLKAYNTIHQYDVICLSETFFDSSVLLDEYNLFIQGYCPIPANDPEDLKRSGVCLYQKRLTLEIIDDCFIAQCIVCEIILHNQTGMFFSCINHQVNLLLSLKNFCLQ